MAVVPGPPAKPSGAKAPAIYRRFNAALEASLFHGARGDFLRHFAHEQRVRGAFLRLARLSHTTERQSPPWKSGPYRAAFGDAMIDAL